MATNPPQAKTLNELRQEAQRRNSRQNLIQESPESLLPAVERVENAVQARFVVGKPLAGSYRQPAIASVGEHEPHTVEINDPAQFRCGGLQTKGHEIVHLWRNNLPGPIQKAGLPDNPKDPYNISNIDQLRAKGHTLATVPQEVAAMIVQTYIADHSQRKRLQVWIDDMNKTPLSVMNATTPGQRGINTTPRPPAPPIEAWTSLLGLKQKRNR